MCVCVLCIYSTFLTLFFYVSPFPLSLFKAGVHKFLLDFKKSIKYSPHAPVKEHPGEPLGMVTKIKLHQELKMRPFYLIFTFAHEAVVLYGSHSEPSTTDKQPWIFFINEHYAASLSQSKSGAFKKGPHTQFHI